MKHHAHETTVLGLFKDPEQARQAMDALAPLGYESDDISLIANHDAYEKEELVDFVAGEKLHRESIRAGKVGGLAGAVIAAATATTAALTGGVSLLAVGPIVAVIAGAGGLLGGLLGTGFTEEEAKEVDYAIDRGDVLVVVHAANRHLAKQAKESFLMRNADVIHAHH